MPTGAENQYYKLTAFFFSAFGGRRFFGLGPFSVSSSSDRSELTDLGWGSGVWGTLTIWPRGRPPQGVLFLFFGGHSFGKATEK